MSTLIEKIDGDKNIDFKAEMTNFEKKLIIAALKKQNGIVAHAAIQLSLRRTTLVEKMKKFGIDRETQ